MKDTFEELCLIDLCTSFIVDVSYIYNSLRLAVHTPASLVYSAAVVCSYVADLFRSDTNQNNEL